jgi:hypothetical protein
VGFAGTRSKKILIRIAAPPFLIAKLNQSGSISTAVVDRTEPVLGCGVPVLSMLFPHEPRKSGTNSRSRRIDCQKRF